MRNLEFIGGVREQGEVGLYDTRKKYILPLVLLAEYEVAPIYS